MKTVIYLLLFSIGYSFAENLVSQSEIDSLIDKADAVVLSDERTFHVKGINEAEYLVKRRVLIKNKNGHRYCEVSLSESKFIEVDDIEAIITDTLGNIIKELDDDDIEEAEISPGYAFYSENKYKWFELKDKTYPYILEYSFLHKIKSLFFWYDLHPQINIPVLSSSYKLILEDEIKYRYYPIGLDISPTTFKVKGDSILIWRANNIPPIKKEKWSPPESKTQNAILFTAIDFELGDSKGSFYDWSTTASFFRSLYQDKLGLTKEMEIDVKNIIAGKTDDYEKIRILYKYLQNKTRYVAIYLNIDGWEPHSAKSIYKNRYGDCKDLSTLMISMLDIAGIDAYPALALTRNEGIVLEDFPSNQFNHCITCVPLEKDTIWLECTADFIDIEDTPYNIEGINTLVVKNDDGELIRTPQKEAKSNKWKSLVTGKLNNKGALSFKSLIDVTGNQKNGFRRFAGFSKAEEEKKVITNQHIKFVPSAKISSYLLTETDLPFKPFLIEAEGKYKGFTNTIGNRIFLNPIIFNRETTDDIPREETRQYPLKILYPYVNIDSVAFIIPSGYELEAAPDTFNLETPFAKYSTSFEIKDNIFYYTRYFEYSSKIIDTKYYAEFLNFINQVVKSDHAKFIFKKS